MRIVERSCRMGGKVAGHPEHLSSGFCSPVRGGECKPIVCPSIKGEALRKYDNEQKHVFSKSQFNQEFYTEAPILLKECSK